MVVEIRGVPFDFHTTHTISQPAAVHFLPSILKPLGQQRRGKWAAGLTGGFIYLFGCGELSVLAS